jgi:hypothetical protein
MEALCSSETSVDTQWTTRLYIPEDGTLRLFVCFLKSFLLDTYLEINQQLKKENSTNIFVLQDVIGRLDHPVFETVYFCFENLQNVLLCSETAFMFLLAALQSCLTRVSSS